MKATTLRIIPYSLYARDSLAAYFSRQHRRGLAFVGGGDTWPGSGGLSPGSSPMPCPIGTIPLPAAGTSFPAG